MYRPRRKPSATNCTPGSMSD